ncbi:MAG: LysR family transcriptional regulator [Dehalococcoidia bacterium]|nr:LysR family transcriptional regulator [Dehalococcoidia bacterium]MDW8119629.1 LysR family transcriptional regulator [Chloroflexota bacterium]
MDIRQLEAFVAVVRTGSFRKAAEHLFLSQPSLSARIQALERDLRQSLFHRRGRGVLLTEVGKALLPYAEEVLETIRQAKQALEAMGSLAHGRLTVGSARVIGTYVLPGILEEFRRRFPGVVVAIRTGRSTEVLQWVEQGEVSVGLARSLVHPEVASFHLYDEEIVLVTHPDHPFARRRQVAVQEVARQPLILYDRGSSYFVLIEDVCRRAGIVPWVLMHLDSVEATKQMVERGLGISFLPRSSLKREIEEGTLTVVPLADGYRVTLPTTVLVRPRPLFPEPLLAFLQVLGDLFPNPDLRALVQRHRSSQGVPLASRRTKK